MSTAQALRVVDAWLTGTAGRLPANDADQRRYRRERADLNAALLQLKRTVEDPDL